ncbi:unnamed protein product [Mucor hiemalis]
MSSYNERRFTTVNTLSVEEKLKIQKLVYKDFYTHHAFIDGDLQLSTARANKIILEYLEKTDTGTQRYQLHDKLVKELYNDNIKCARSIFIDTLKKHVQAYNYEINFSLPKDLYYSKLLYRCRYIPLLIFFRRVLQSKIILIPLLALLEKILMKIMISSPALFLSPCMRKKFSRQDYQ